MYLLDTIQNQIKLYGDMRLSSLKTSFSGHDKFDCKIDWIIKGLEAFDNDNTILQLSNVEKGIQTLGLGINMIKSLNYWMKTLELIEKDHLTDLGRIIFQKDPFLENDNTLWLLHWNLVKNINKSTLYYLFFNKIYQYRFTKNSISNEVNKWLETNQIKLSQNSLNSDIDVFLRMYANDLENEKSMSLFTDLNSITKTKENYILNIKSSSKITDEVFIYILNDYIQLKKKDKVGETISIDDIQRGDLSIQKSLLLSENGLFSKINKLSTITNNKLEYSEASGMRQIYIKEQLNSTELLNNIMDQR